MTFQELNISPEVCEHLLRRGIKEPTPVQEQAIPIARSGCDLVVQSQTGTGKTLAFLLPVFEKLKKGVPVTQALIVTPTRELTVQIAKIASSIGKVMDIRTLAIYGGQDIERQKEKLRRHPQLIIGTPGRLLDHFRRHTISLGQVNKVVLDEADEMLKLGFYEDVEHLLRQVASDRQIMLFSATMPDRVRGLSNQFMNSPKQIAIKSEHVTLDSIRQVIIDTTEETKLDKLCEIINTEQPYLAMVFCHTKKRASMVAMALARRGYLVDELHGELSQTQRTLVLKRFRKAELQILTATDIAARGLDIEGVTHVINYDIPMNAEWYIHRIGRTGRAGGTGTAITFVNARQYELLRRIESGIRARIEKRRSEKSRQRAIKQAKFKADALKEKLVEQKAKKPKPLSKYANRKGASHKGRNLRSRRQNKR